MMMPDFLSYFFSCSTEITKLNNDFDEIVQENASVLQRVSTQDMYHLAEMENLRHALNNVSKEHMISLKNDLDTVSKERITLRVQLDEVEDKFVSSQNKVNMLMQEKQALERELRDSEVKMRELENTLCLLDDENRRLLKKKKKLLQSEPIIPVTVI